MPPQASTEPWSAEHLTAIGNIAISPPRTSVEAWQGINATDTIVADRIYTDAVIASRGDNVVTLIGGTVSHHIARGQQRDFEERNADILDLLAGYFGTALNDALHQSVIAAVNKTPLRPNPHAPHQSTLYTTIKKCGMQRTALDAEGNVLLTPYIIIDLTLISSAPLQVHLTRTIHKNALKTHQHTASAYATDPALMNAALKAILDQFEFQIAGRLRERLRERLAIQEDGVGS